MSFNVEIADLLEKMAMEVDRQPVAPPAAPKVASAPAKAEPTKAAKLAELIQNTTGEAMPTALAEKIASDADLLEHVTKLAESNARPNSLGEAVVREGSAPPVTRAEKVAAAWDNWNNSTRNG